MEVWQMRANALLDGLFRTGYPHLINLFTALMLLALPVLSVLTGETLAMGVGRWTAIGVVTGVYLLLWMRLPVTALERRAGWLWLYLLVQSGFVVAIYSLEGGLSRLLFVLVAVQAIYLSPIRRWAPFVFGSLAALWLTLFLVISPSTTGANLVAQIGMYFCYFVFAVVVSYTVAQQERQRGRAAALQEEVDRRHRALRELDLTMAAHSGEEERERLATTIHADLVQRLTALREGVEGVLGGRAVSTAHALSHESVRSLRLAAKATLGAVRDAVRTLRPSVDEKPLEDEPAPPPLPLNPDVALRATDPIRLYHIWNLLVVGLTTGVMFAAYLVKGGTLWLWIASIGAVLFGIYFVTAYGGPHWHRALWLVIQAALISWLVWLTGDPLFCHLYLIVAAQILFLMPLAGRTLATAVVFPTILAGGSLWLSRHMGLVELLSWTGAFGVLYFFSAVMAYMTRRQLEGRRQALRYAAEMAEVNRQLEARLESVRQVAIAAERVRMAREIHDGLGHHLTTVIVELQMAEQLAGDEPEGARAHLQIAAQVIDQALQAAHQMVEELERFERPLAVAVRELLVIWQRQNPAQVVLQLNGSLYGLTTATRMTLYRALQESLTNIQKHAEAKRVEIHLLRLADRVLLRVVNDDQRPGRKMGEGGGFGLVGLRERAEALHGSFKAKALETGGFVVEMVLPVGG
jgi:signal transduction histidine kinase